MRIIEKLLIFCLVIAVIDELLSGYWDVLDQFELINFISDLLYLIGSFVLLIIISLQNILYLDVLFIFSRIVEYFIVVIAFFGMGIIDFVFSVVRFPFRMIGDGLLLLGIETAFTFNFDVLLIQFDLTSFTFRIAIWLGLDSGTNVQAQIQFSMLGDIAKTVFGKSFDSIGFFGFDIGLKLVALGNELPLEVALSLEDSVRAVISNVFQEVYTPKGIWLKFLDYLS